LQIVFRVQAAIPYLIRFFYEAHLKRPEKKELLVDGSFDKTFSSCVKEGRLSGTTTGEYAWQKSAK